MSNFKPVTTAQLGQIGKMSREKGLGRDVFQQGLDNRTFATALDAVKQGRTIILAPELEPPPGGRICTICVPVVLDRPWQEAVNAAGPNTPDNYDVQKVGDLYLPTGKGIIEDEVVLMNFGLAGGNWDRAIAWAKQFGLQRTDPRRVFAIGEHKPELHHELEMDPMYVVATQDCFFGGRQQACYVWWNGAGRGALLRWVSDYGLAGDWFAFSRECPPQADK